MTVSVSCVFSFGVVRFDCLCACANRVGICGLQVYRFCKPRTYHPLQPPEAHFFSCLHSSCSASRGKSCTLLGYPCFSVILFFPSFLHDAQWISPFLRQQTHLFCHFLAHHFDQGRICRRHLGWRPWQPMHHQFPTHVALNAISYLR